MNEKKTESDCSIEVLDTEEIPLQNSSREKEKKSKFKVEKNLFNSPSEGSSLSSENFITPTNPKIKKRNSQKSTSKFSKFRKKFPKNFYRKNQNSL